MELLVEALHRVIHNQDLEDLPSFGLDTLRQDQTKIGWQNLLKGRLSKRWASIQQAYLESRPTTASTDNDQRGLQWTVSTIDCIFKCWLDLWDIRNQDRHGKDLEAQLRRDKEQAQREVQALYDQRPSVPQRLQSIFLHPLATMLQKSTCYLRAFINSFKPVIEKDYSEDLNTG